MGELYPENRAKRIFSIECFFAPNDSRHGSIRTYFRAQQTKSDDHVNKTVACILILIVEMASEPFSDFYAEQRSFRLK
jgi:hypothetical protein